MVGAPNVPIKHQIFSTKAKISLDELCMMRQHLCEDLDMHVRRFHERAMDCYDQVDGEVFVNVYLYGMMEEHHSFLENLSFSLFSRLMEAGRCIKD